MTDETNGAASRATNGTADGAPGGPARDGEAHPPFERLSELADGALDGAARAAVERHLAACAACRADADALGRVLALAASVPRAVEPPPAVWAAVRTRIAAAPRAAAHTAAHPATHPATHPAARARRGWWRRPTTLGAVAGLLAAASVAVLVLRPSRPDAAGTPVDAVARQAHAADSAARELTTTLATIAATSGGAAALPPAAQASLDRNLALVESAIAEARAALASDPGNVDVADALGAAQERRVELLLQATRILTDE